MSDLEKDMRDLRERTDQSRRQFLEVEIQTCFTAIERAHLEFSLGRPHEARRELEIANHGADVVEHFLHEAPGEMADIEAKWRDLKSALEPLRAELGPPGS